MTAVIRDELANSTAVRLEELPARAGPARARSVDLVTLLTVVATTSDIMIKLPEVVAVIRKVYNRFAHLGRIIRVKLAGVEFDPGTRSDEQFMRAVRSQIVPPATGLREALIIANSRYRDPRLSRLRAPGHDAKALRHVLADPNIGDFNVETILDADETTIRRGIGEFFADRGSQDMLLLHFSGHGIKDPRGRLYLATRDTNLSRLNTTAISADLIKDEMASSPSQRIALLLDCCYSGAFTRGSVARGISEVSMTDTFGTGRGHVVLTASGATEYAFEDGELTTDQARPSFFTQALVSGLQTGDADLNSDGAVDVDELYSYIFQTVRRRTPDQIPGKSSLDVEGKLIIAKSSRRTQLPEAICQDLRSDRPVLRQKAVADLKQLLGGEHHGLRNAATAELTRLRDHDDSSKVRNAANEALGCRQTPTSAASRPRNTPQQRPPADQTSYKPAAAPQSARKNQKNQENRKGRGNRKNRKNRKNPVPGDGRASRGKFWGLTALIAVVVIFLFLMAF